MSKDADPQTPALPSSCSLITTLSGIAVMSGILVVLVHQWTLPKITENKREALEQAVFSVLPGATVRSNFLVKATGITALPSEDISTANVFAGYDDEAKLVGFSLYASARGYQDAIRLLYGYAPDLDCVIGISVLQSKETPGLGNKVETDPGFLANFDCLDAELNAEGTALQNEIVAVKHGTKTAPWQIDGISGATVTSTAIGKALRDSANDMLPLLARHVRATGEQR